jgi:hypothetical protein
MGSGRAENGCAKSDLEEGKRRKENAPEAPNVSEEKKPRRRRRLRKRVPIGEALRRKGLDEHSIADTYAQVVDNLKGPRRAGSNEKLLVEILKECTRQIEAAQPTGEGSIQVKLVHNVERPARARTGEIGTAEASKEKLP